MKVCFNGLRSNLADAFNDVVEAATATDENGNPDIDAKPIAAICLVKSSWPGFRARRT